MRRAQLVKRRRVSGALFFVGFLWIGAGMGIDIKSGLIAKDFSGFLEEKLNTIFVDKQVRLSGIELGGIRNLAISDISVYRKTPPSPIFSVDKLIVKYSLLNLALRQFEKLGAIYLVSPTLFFTADEGGNLILPKKSPPYLSRTSAHIGGPIKLHILNGNITVLGREPILRNLEGQVSLYKGNLIFNNLKGHFLNLPVLVNGRIDNVLEAPVIKLRFVAMDKYYTATCTFKSAAQRGKGFVWGSFRLFDRFDIRFKGMVDIASGKVMEIKRLVVTQPFVLGSDPPKEGRGGFVISGDINLSDRSSKFIIIPNSKASLGQTDNAQAGEIKIITRKNDGDGLAIYVKLNHINLFGYDVLSQINISANFFKRADSDEILRGVLRTQNLILNYKPFKEIGIRGVLKKRELFITSLELGDAYRLFGKVSLIRPYDMDLNLSINNAELADWLIFSRYDQQGVFSGLVNGKIKVSGPLDEPVSEGKINVKDGNIEEIKFDAINFNLKGKGPLLAISDSMIFKEGGFLYIDGEVDLRKFGKRNVFEDVKIRTDEKVIVWEGWDITKSTSEVKATKDLGKDFGVNFKTYVDTGYIDKDRRKNEIGLDYKIKKDDSVSVRMKDDSAFVGVEHKIKF